MSEIVYEVAGLLALIIANGVFAMSEIAVVSSRKALLQERAEQGVRGAKAAWLLANDPGTFLATVQIGITLVGVLAGAFAGTTLAHALARAFSSVEMVRPYAEELGFGIVVVAITYLSLVIGELVPKRLSIGKAELIAARIARPMQLLSRIAFPIVRLLDYSTRALLWLMRVRPAAEPPVSEDELRILVRQATTAGVLEKSEHEMMTNVLDFGDRNAASLMTRRSEVVFLSTQEPLDACWKKVHDSGHTHFPLCAGSLDEVIGTVSVDALVGNLSIQSAQELDRFARPALYIPETAPAVQVLETFKQSSRRLAIVIDEYGVPQGIISLSDVLQALVGAVPAAEGLVESAILHREDGSWLLDGLVSVDQFRTHFKTAPLPRQDHGGFGTVGGFMMTFLGRIPRVGDKFEWGGYRFEVIDMDARRVDKVLLTPLKKQ